MDVREKSTFIPDLLISGDKALNLTTCDYLFIISLFMLPRYQTIYTKDLKPAGCKNTIIKTKWKMVKMGYLTFDGCEKGKHTRGMKNASLNGLDIKLRQMHIDKHIDMGYLPEDHEYGWLPKTWALGRTKIKKAKYLLTYE